MARAVLLIGCLLTTISSLTTAQSTTSINAITPSPHANSTSPNATTTLPSSINMSPNITDMASNATTMLPNTNNMASITTTMSPNTTNMPSNATTMSPNRTNAASNVTTMSPNRTNVAPNAPPNATTTNATTPQAPLFGSCAKPDLCCSGLNGSCRRLNCYCDVACLRFNDCCPDFKPTCLTVKNGTSNTNTLPLTGTCSHPSLCCSGTNYNCFRGCFCDEACKQLKDCCPDVNSTCIFNTTTSANFTAIRPVSPSALPPFTPSPTPPKDVLTLLTNLEVEVLAEESSTEAERQAALLQVGELVESYLRGYNDIYSFEVTRIEPVSQSTCD